MKLIKTENFLENNQNITIAKRVLELEKQGIEALAESLDEYFVKAVELIASIRGRVIVSGMGKSGHVARKIAATLSSTGTSSFFVHPGEASHGDMGMITIDDVVIVLSNSGETHEIKDIINYCKRFSIPVIAIVRNGESTLAGAADITLVLPEIPEACDVPAPTTSTTMMMALGDALSIVLLEKKQFSKEDYKQLHPGGKLGAIFSKVDDIMHKGDEIPLVTIDCLMSDALITMTAKRLGCVGVVDNNKLVGIICDGDLRRHMCADLLSLKVFDIMTSNPKTIRANSLVVEAIKVMNEKAITSLFIVEDGQPLGIVHIHDCLRVGAK
jgi:arabinose-5-phosphate isomerase